MHNSAIDPTQLTRALVVKLRHHGDVLLAAPVLTALRHFAPQCEVDALVYADTAPMLSAHPHLSQLHTIDRRWKTQGIGRQAQAEYRLLQQLRRRKYDLAIHLTVHTRGAWLVRLLRPRWSVAPDLPHKPGKERALRFWRNSFTHLYAAQSHPDRHTVETNLDSLRVLGWTPTDEDKRVILRPGEAAEARIEQWLAQQGLLAGRYIHLHPASRWRFKCWPSERVAALCDELALRGWPVVLSAAPDAEEMALVRAVRSVARAPTFDLSGQLTLKELAALAARARLFVGVDSAPMHIAAAMGTPTVAIFGPSGEREWGPWHTAHRIVASTIHNCRPCGRAGCNDSKVSECLTTLPVGQVLAACLELL